MALAHGRQRLPERVFAQRFVAPAGRTRIAGAARAVTAGKDEVIGPKVRQGFERDGKVVLRLVELHGHWVGPEVQELVHKAVRRVSRIRVEAYLLLQHAQIGHRGRADLALDGEARPLDHIVVGAQALLPPLRLADGARGGERRQLLLLEVERDDRRDLRERIVGIPVIAVAHEDEVWPHLLDGLKVDGLRLRVDGDVGDAFLLHQRIEVRVLREVCGRDRDAERDGRVLEADHSDALRPLGQDGPAVLVADDEMSVFFGKHLVRRLLRPLEAGRELFIDGLGRISAQCLGVEGRRALRIARYSLAAATAQGEAQHGKYGEEPPVQESLTHRTSPHLPRRAGTGCSAGGRCAGRAGARRRCRRHRRASPR